jgi:hypothetical protein
MIKAYKKLLTFMLFAGMVSGVSAQNQADISIFLNASSKDASKLLEAYLEPTVKSLSYGMTANWYTTAATHKTLGFDFSFSANIAFIPTSEDYFNPDKLNLSVTTYDGNIDRPGKGAPTFFGPKDETQYSATYDPDGSGPLGNQTVTFNGPEGLAVKDKIGFAGIPVPVAQLGIGIVKNTDLKFRFIPKVEAGSSEVQMFGVGVQHDIKQHIKGIKLLPFDLSVLVAFNSLKGSTDLSDDDATDSRPDSEDGEGVYKFNSWLFQALISKKIAVLTFYGGVGYSFINTSVDMNGTYTITPDVGPTFDIKDPVSMDIKNKSMRFTAGMRLKLGPVYFNGDYTLQKYKMLSVGMGFSIR